MNPATVEMYKTLRHGTRNLLLRKNVLSNPGVSDAWIVNQLRSLAQLPEIEDYETLPGRDFTVFKNSLIHILTQKGVTIPKEQKKLTPDNAQDLVDVLYGLLR